MEQFDFMAVGDITTDAFIRLKNAEVNCDIDKENCKLCLDFGSKIPYESVIVVPAVGNSPNASVSAHRLGLKSAIVTNLGNDRNGEEMLEQLKKEGVEADLQHAVIDASMQGYVKLLGRVSDQVLEQVFSLTSLHLFPVLDLPGDVEGFGMVAIEAAIHGVPTIAFNAGGVPDSVKDKVTGYLVDAEDYDAFSQAVLQGLEALGKELSPQRCIEYATRFSWENYGRRLGAICEQTLSSDI